MGAACRIVSASIPEPRLSAHDGNERIGGRGVIIKAGIGAGTVTGVSAIAQSSLAVPGLSGDVSLPVLSVLLLALLLVVLVAVELGTRGRRGAGDTS